MSEVRKKSPRSMKVRVGAVQMISTVGDVDGNIEKALSYCDKAAERGVEILCFPECASTGFDWVQNGEPKEEVYAEPVPGPMVDAFADKAKKKDLYIIFGVVEGEKRSSKIYNTAFLVGPDEGYVGKYRKVLSENVFENGTKVDVFDTRYGKIGIFICADMRSPEIARLLVARGARILFQPTNYFHPDGIGIRRRYMGKCTAQRTRAMDNGVHLVIANAGRNEYVNNSRIISPDGQGPEPRLAYATHKEQLLAADIEYDPDANPVARQARSRPWLFRELGEQMLKVS